MAVFALSIHADYGCRHSGACCSAGWDVPVETPVYRTLSEALARGRLRPVRPDESPLHTGAGLPDGAAAMLARTAREECVFLDGGSRLCVVHRDLGEAALPAACRHFPRVALRDPRGTFVTLSHFCPTAAAMLFRKDVALEIVESPPAFPETDYGGLAVQPDAWPPLLHPRMLMDLESYSAWERHVVSRCADAACAPEGVTATLARDAALLRAWKPGAQTLAIAVAGLPRETVPADAPASLADSARLHGEVARAVPEDLAPAPDAAGLDAVYTALVRPEWRAHAAVINRFLAAKGFASWLAYQGRGLATIVRSLEAALAVLRVEAARRCRDARAPLSDDLLLEAFRGADLLLHHLAAGDALAAAWSRADGR